MPLPLLVLLLTVAPRRLRLLSGPATTVFADEFNIDIRLLAPALNTGLLFAMEELVVTAAALLLNGNLVR